jgi:uncharacterized protein (TIGR00369 family)
VLDPVFSDDRCFCCGRNNERGLKLQFTYDGEGGATTRTTIPEWFSGWKSMTHGGFLSTLLDECMAHACISAHGHAITADLSVRYHAPVPVGTEVEAVGKVETVRARIIETSGVIFDSAQQKIASARARFLLVPDASSS